MRKKDARARRQNASYAKLVMRWMSKLASNYRVEVTDRQQEVFLDGLVPWTDYQINTAMDRAMIECLFFPNLAEVLERMPADTGMRGPIKTCAMCKPDGYRVVISGDRRVIIRCDHDSANASAPNFIDDTIRPLARTICREQYQRDYDKLDATNPDENRIIFECCWLAARAEYKRQGRDMAGWPTLEESKPKGPRWPHLKGKGIAPMSKP